MKLGNEFTQRQNDLFRQDEPDRQTEPRPAPFAAGPRGVQRWRSLTGHEASQRGDSLRSAKPRRHRAAERDRRGRRIRGRKHSRVSAPRPGARSRAAMTIIRDRDIPGRNSKVSRRRAGLDERSGHGWQCADDHPSAAAAVQRIRSGRLASTSASGQPEVIPAPQMSLPGPGGER